MQAGALVYCLLDAEGAYTPDGYEALDTAVAGDYELKLWRGIQHRDGQPVKFNELSLNVKGRNFDPESQAQKVPRRSTHALGRRDDLLRIVASWLKDYPTLYIGSYIQSKVRFYHRIFTHYMPMLDVSATFAAFDECEGQPEYFTVSAKSGVIESILEGLDDVDVQRYINELTPVMDQAISAACKQLDKAAEDSNLYPENFNDVAASIVDYVVIHFHLDGDDDEAIRNYNTILHHLLKYVERKYPDSDLDRSLAAADGRAARGHPAGDVQ